MKTTLFVLMIVMSFFFLTSCDKEFLGQINQEKVERDWYVVTMDESFFPLMDSSVLNVHKDMVARYDQHINALTGKMTSFLDDNQLTAVRDSIGDVYGSFFTGFSIPLSEVELLELQGNPLIESILEDEILDIELPQFEIEIFNSQVEDWGVQETGRGDGSGLSNIAWIIDTGIDLDHPDLNVDTDLSRSFFRVGNASTRDDRNGHGTHVAGIIAARDNFFGSVGIAAGAKVVGVKVTDGFDRFNYRKFIKGLDYVNGCALPGDVVNISLRFGKGTPRFNRRQRIMRRAVQRLGERSIYVTIAAGNDSDDADSYYPARINGDNVYTISAMREGSFFAAFSNFGEDIDFCAPGVNNYSCTLDGGYAFMSGTSMAAPHVAGILLMNGGVINTNGTVLGDPDGDPDPIAVR